MGVTCVPCSSLAALVNRIGAVLRRWRHKVTLGALAHNRWSEPPNAIPSTLHCVEQAHREWLDAKAYFENVAHPDLVEHAVHVLLAAEKRYEYLLREAKSEGIVAVELLGTLNTAPMN